MTEPVKKTAADKVFLFFTIAFCAVLLVLLTVTGFTHSGCEMDSFSEPVITLSDNCSVISSDGRVQTIGLPYTIDYGADGSYTLSHILPYNGESLQNPAFCFYSNYVDVTVELDGKVIYSYPEDGYLGPTGNTYHFVRLPVGYAGKTVVVRVDCQLGDDITYLLKAPVLGAKATMLRRIVMESLPAIMLSGCMLVLAVGLTALYLCLRHRLQLNRATVYTAIFAALFAVYVFCETSFAQTLTPNGYVLFCLTLLLLTILPIPLVGLFAEEVSERFKKVPTVLMTLCAVNLVVQTVLNYTGISCLRVTLPATHGVIIVSITIMVVCLFFSDRKEKPEVRFKLLTALPMIIGGLADIILLIIERPSINNSFWFTFGVTAFIVIQFATYVRGFFLMYRTALETDILRNMAYRDVLTDIGNRNAYERRLKELSQRTLNGDVGCIVLDINDLKLINDNLGHSAGDAAIVETGRLLCELMPSCASCFRTGGDEFVVLLDGFKEESMADLSHRLICEAAARGCKNSIPLSLAVGFGCYKPSDGSVVDFIRRVDTLMYCSKRDAKKNEDYPFAEFINKRITEEII